MSRYWALCYAVKKVLVPRDITHTPRHVTSYRGVANDYRTVVDIDKITSYTQNEKMGRITFNQTLDFIKNISFLADNSTVVLHLVGW
eukprot:SAG31_NODE_30216_length_384_cov_0.708772_1_plen_86_part_01